MNGTASRSISQVVGDARLIGRRTCATETLCLREAVTGPGEKKKDDCVDDKPLRGHTDQIGISISSTGVFIISTYIFPAFVGQSLADLAATKHRTRTTPSLNKLILRRAMCGRRESLCANAAR